MKRLSRLRLGIAAGALLVMFSLGCTIRYSQTLVGTIEPIEGMPLKNQADAFALGLYPAAGIAFSEPTESSQLLDLPCDVALSQVDYRAMWFSVYLTFLFPKIEGTAYCIR